MHRDVTHVRQLVIAQADGHDTAVIQTNFLADSHPQSLNKPSFNLSLVSKRIDHDRDIVKGADLSHGDLAGLRVYLDIADGGLKDMFARPLASIIVSITSSGFAGRQRSKSDHIHRFRSTLKPHPAVSPVDPLWIDTPMNRRPCSQRLD